MSYSRLYRLHGTMWGHQWKGRSVQCFTDNAATVAITNSGRSKNQLAMHLMRCLYFLLRPFCQLVFVWWCLVSVVPLVRRSGWMNCRWVIDERDASYVAPPTVRCLRLCRARGALKSARDQLDLPGSLLHWLAVCALRAA